MKKILEVLQYGDNDFRFNTDLDLVKHQKEIEMLPVRLVFTMITKLWGGNELAVLTAIRALAIADLAASVNREQMIRHLDHDSKNLARILFESKKEFERAGGKVDVFYPGSKPGGCKIKS